MRKTLPLIVVAMLCGCDARTGSSAQMPDVAVYPGAKVVSNGENNGVIGANLEVVAPRPQVIAFYAKELGTQPDPSGAGNLSGTKAGHQVKIIVTDAGQGKTAVSIIEPK